MLTHLALLAPYAKILIVEGDMREMGAFKKHLLFSCIAAP
jgi:hypothetical protein